jgi:hypothetical protein
MHANAYRFITEVVTRSEPRRLKILEMGSKDVNGSVRPLFYPCDYYVGIDLIEGKGVDIVADAVIWKPSKPMLFDCVVCTEVLEHASAAAELCINAYCLLEINGMFLITCAGPNRPEHSIDGGHLKDNEFYRNVSPELLHNWLRMFSYRFVDSWSVPTDTYAVAIK